jgi:hypothetical protein
MRPPIYAPSGAHPLRFAIFSSTGNSFGRCFDFLWALFRFSEFGSLLPIAIPAPVPTARQLLSVNGSPTAKPSEYSFSCAYRSFAEGAVSGWPSTR